MHNSAQARALMPPVPVRVRLAVAWSLQRRGAALRLRVDTVGARSHHRGCHTGEDPLAATADVARLPALGSDPRGLPSPNHGSPACLRGGGAKRLGRRAVAPDDRPRSARAVLPRAHRRSRARSSASVHRRDGHRPGSRTPSPRSPGRRRGRRPVGALRGARRIALLLGIPAYGPAPHRWTARSSSSARRRRARGGSARQRRRAPARLSKRRAMRLTVASTHGRRAHGPDQ
jgi:hypothetical protein